MSLDTTIEWTEATWNPVTGCSKISSGCAHCYAERMAKRLSAMGQYRYRNGFRVTVHPDLLEQPLLWKKPCTIFVNSMGDLFHKEVPFEFIQKVFGIMSHTPWHTYQILTKRAERLEALAANLVWPVNAWMGVTVEDSDYKYRIDLLRKVPTSVRFISFEPLLGSIKEINLQNINWCIVGGESGPGSRPMLPNWARTIRDNCLEQGTPFFFKQWGGVRKKKNGRILDGEEWNQFPEVKRKAV